MNQKYAYLKKKPVNEIKGKPYQLYYRPKRLAYVCIDCGYNSKYIKSNVCPICKNGIYEYQTKIAIPKFKSKKWKEFVYYILERKLSYNSTTYFYKNNPAKHSLAIYFVDEEFEKLLRYSSICEIYNICPNLKFIGRKERQKLIKNIQKSTTPFY